MNIDPRPPVDRIKLLATVILFVVVMLAIPLLDFWTPATAAAGGVKPSGMIALTFTMPSWYWRLALSLCTSLLSVTVFELVSMGLQRGIWRRQGRKAFDQFWGDEASRRCKDGIVFLQADKIDVLLEEYAIPGIKDSIDSKTDGRLFKARDWMNYFDTMGARAVIKAFRDFGLDPPEMIPIKSRVDTEASRTARQSPFTIVMGLGFSVATDALISRVSSDWMRIGHSGGYGDVLELLDNLVPPQLQLFQTIPSPHSGFKQILPAGTWDLAAWLAGDATSKTRASSGPRDYAVIMRHTEIDSANRRQMTFVLAGFTEMGTAAAGEYLANNWEKMWKSRVQENYKKASMGDFLLVIGGPSHYNHIREWGVDKMWYLITPERLADQAKYLTECPWVKRMNA